MRRIHAQRGPPECYRPLGQVTTETRSTTTPLSKITASTVWPWPAAAVPKGGRPLRSRPVIEDV
jgi:hypothetical protein